MNLKANCDHEGVLNIFGISRDSDTNGLVKKFGEFTEEVVFL